MLVGSAPAGASSVQPADQINGWSSTPVESGLPTAISCASSSFCVAVDGGGGVVTFNGTSWSTPTNIDISGGLDSRFCPTSNFCATFSNTDAYVYTGSSGPTTTETTTTTGPGTTQSITTDTQPPSTNTQPITTSSPPATTPPPATTGTQSTKTGTPAAATPKPVFVSFTGSAPAVSSNGSFSLGVSCPKGKTGCSENVSLTVTTVGGKIASAATAKKKPKPKPKTVTLASSKIKLAAGKKSNPKLKLSKTGLSYLKSAKGHKLKVTAVITAGRTTSKKTLTLKHAPAKKTKK